LRLVWPSATLCGICSSSEAAESVWPATWQEVIYIFTLISATRSWDALLKMRVLSLSPADPTMIREGTVTISHKSTSLTVKHSTQKTSAVELLILDVVSDGISGLRVAS
jgi:hypothetical protein